mmetsp:Transcript_5318/g.4996  ORF Transcript_5318/g.4996 Transcript_5318/m.4996 type:complete len:84 (-) Transcript_5318:1183-1434(-)
MMRSKANILNIWLEERPYYGDRVDALDIGLNCCRKVKDRESESVGFTLLKTKGDRDLLLVPKGIDLFMSPTLERDLSIDFKLL